MKVISLNVSLPKTVEFRGNKVSTGIYNEPVEGRVKVRTLNLDGDEQADLTVHGGPDKAVYAYPSEHYPYWRDHYPDLEMDWGMFGENFTTEGLLEDQTNIGDEYQIGSAKFAVTQPRMPCFKLGIKFGTADIIKKFFTSDSHFIKSVNSSYRLQVSFQLPFYVLSNTIQILCNPYN